MGIERERARKTAASVRSGALFDDRQLFIFFRSRE